MKVNLEVNTFGRLCPLGKFRTTHVEYKIIILKYQILEPSPTGTLYEEKLKISGALGEPSEQLIKKIRI